MNQAKEYRQTPPQFVVICLDDSEYFKETDKGRALLERCGGKICSVHVYDQNLHVYICSSTPTYEMHFIECVAGGESKDSDEDERERLFEDLLELGISYEPVSYNYTNDVDRRPASSKHVFDAEKTIPEDEAEYRDMLEATLEHVRGNSYF
jgi:hypothetical protein